MQEREAKVLKCDLNKETLKLIVTFDVKDEEGSDIQLTFTIRDVEKLMNINEVRYQPFVLEGTQRQVTPSYGNRETNKVCFGYKNGYEQTGTVYYNQKELADTMRNHIEELWRLEKELEEKDGESF